MERLGTSVLLILLVAPAAAIDDPAGDVTRTLGETVDAPYVDIRAVSYLLREGEMDLTMRLDAAVSTAPAGATLNFIFPFDLDGNDNGTVYGQEDGTIFCTMTAGQADLRCRDSSEAFTIRRVGVNGDLVTATVILPDPPVTVAVAGAASQVDNGTIIAQDFTDNALPYASRAPDETGGEVTQKDPWWKGPAILWLAAAIGIGGALLWNRYRA